MGGKFRRVTESISVHTVNTYRQHILEKLNVDNSHEAVRYGLSLGLIEY